MATAKTKHSAQANDVDYALTMAINWPCLRLTDQDKLPHYVIDISVSPNAKKTEAVGWHDGALRVRLNAPPVDGAANEALRRWLANEIGLPMNTIELLRGASGRRKQLAVHGPCAQVVNWLERLTKDGALSSK